MTNRRNSEGRAELDTPAQTAIVVFAKAPLPGHAKTRLIPALGATGAAALARRMLAHAVAAAWEANLGPVEICAAPDCADPVFAELGARYGTTLATQGDGDLGARMHRALTRALRSAPCALLVGTDVPALDAALLRSAAHALLRKDAVFVPALDGGYVLVGLRRRVPELFIDIPWSTPAVMTQTRVRTQALGLQVAELAAVADIDNPEDLVHLPPAWRADLAASQRRCIQTTRTETSE